MEKQLQRIDGEYIFTSLKNGKTRTITAAPSVIQTLRKQKAAQNEWRLMAGEAWDNNMNLVFTYELGGHMVHQTVYKAFKRVVEWTFSPHSGIELITFGQENRDIRAAKS